MSSNVPPWFLQNLGWKSASDGASAKCIKYFGVPFGPNLADLSGASSTRIAGLVYEKLGIPESRRVAFDIGSIESEKNKTDEAGRPKLAKLSAPGARLEEDLRDHLQLRLQALDAQTDWEVSRTARVSSFAQYEHLEQLQQLLDVSPNLKTSIGRDYQVRPDVLVSVPNPWAGGANRSLHAAVSSKLTIRSDRAQNVRVEFGTLVRNRRGRLPHLVVVTAEPLPSRLLSLGRGTGEIDAIYHLLFEPMAEATLELKDENRFLSDQSDYWTELTTMGRIRPFSELPEVLASG